MKVNGLDAPDCPMTFATSAGYLQYPCPAIFLTSVQQPFPGSMQLGNPIDTNGEIPLHSSWVLPASVEAPQDNMMDVSDMPHIHFRDSEAVPMDASPQPVQNDLPLFSDGTTGNEDHRPYMLEAPSNMESGVDMFVRAAEGQALADGRNSRNPIGVSQLENNHNLTRVLPRSETRDSLLGVNFPSNIQEGHIDGMNLWSNTGGWSNVNVQVMVADHSLHESEGWELPFLQGWMMGQTQAGVAQSTLHSQHCIIVVPNIPIDARGIQRLQENLQGNQDATMIPSTNVRNVTRSGTSRGNRSRGTTHRGLVNSNTEGASSSVLVGILHGFANRDPNLGLSAAEASPQLPTAAAAAAAELPCTVKLRIWPHSMKHPTAALDPGTCKLTIPHAVLCR